MHPIITSLCISVVILVCCYSGFAQTAARKDSILHTVRSESDSIYHRGITTIDTTIKNLKGRASFQKNQLTQVLKSAKNQITTDLFHRNVPNKDSLTKNLLSNPYNNLLHFSKPLMHFDGGYLAYNFNYRSNTDTPYAEKDIAQHMINGSVNFTVAKSLPFVTNFWLRRSNSLFYRNITDVQLQFNAAAFKNLLVQNLRERLLAAGNGRKDSTLEKLYFSKNQKLSDLQSWLQNPLTFQKYVQANETLKVPEINYNPALPDSTNKNNTDSLQQVARLYMDEYEKQKGR